MYKILIVEDDRTIARVLASHLEKWEYEVRCTEDFHNVMAEFLAFDPQLVMLDIALPFFNGFHWCQEIRKVSQVPVIFLSSLDDNMNIVMAMNMGGDEFIEKPFDQAALKQQVERMLQEARERRVRNERRSLNEALLRKLTAREQQVLERITAGRLNKQIADDLGISIKTVEAHRASIMDKTNSGTVADLMRVVLGAGLKQNDGL